MRENARGMLREIEADFDPDLPISRLSTGQEQLVQIAGALGTGARVVIMDERPVSLSVRESEHLFQLLAKLRSVASRSFTSHTVWRRSFVCATP